MTKFWIAATVAAVLAAPAFAQDGDAAAGEKVFSQCQTCHHIVDPDGNVLAGRANTKTGPNLWGVVGRQAGTEAEFASGRPGYRDAIVAAGEKGLVWTQEEIAKYVQDPTAFLREYTGDSGARSGMAFKVRSEDDAKNIAAFLATFSLEEAPAATN